MSFSAEENEVYLYPAQCFFVNQPAKSILNITVDIGTFNIDFVCSGVVYSPGYGKISFNYSMIKNPNSYYHDIQKKLLKFIDIAMDNEDERHISFKKFSVLMKNKTVKENFDINLEGKKITATMIRSEINTLKNKFNLWQENQANQNLLGCTIL